MLTSGNGHYSFTSADVARARQIERMFPLCKVELLVEVTALSEADPWSAWRHREGPWGTTVRQYGAGYPSRLVIDPSEFAAWVACSPPPETGSDCRTEDLFGSGERVCAALLNGKEMDVYPEPDGASPPVVGGAGGWFDAAHADGEGRARSLAALGMSPREYAALSALARALMEVRHLRENAAAIREKQPDAGAALESLAREVACRSAAAAASAAGMLRGRSIDPGFNSDEAAAWRALGKAFYLAEDAAEVRR